MAKSSTKRRAKPASKPSNSSPTQSTSTIPTIPSKASSSSSSSTPPAPYSLPPPALHPFLENLNPTHIYIVHIDNHPRAFKRRVFSVPVLMNVVIAILLVWRARVAIPSYVAIAFVTLGHENAAKIGIANTDWSTLIWIVASRATMFLIDTSLARFILPWPIEFFLGSPASPIMWRWKVGFHDQEIIVRKSRKWDRELPNDWLAEESDGFVYKERIMPGIDRAYVQAKTGYLMIDDKNWDLAFAEMITAHALVSQGTATISDFQKSVIVYSNSHGWLVWSVYKLDEGHQEEGRKKLVLFKDKLTAMGKESLFFQWIELLQYETSQSNGFTKARQVDAMKKAKELFESQGVDFEEFWKDVGGVDGLPGMEVTR